jgi:hypothetical protein
MNEKRWDAVRQFYMESFGISPELVDLMASNEILLMCVSGASNSSISRILNIDKDAVEEILLTIFSFNGWEDDIEFSPYGIYQADPSYISFVGSIADLNMEFNVEPNLDIDEINTMYFNCKTYSEIEDKMEVGWK